MQPKSPFSRHWSRGVATGSLLCFLFLIGLPPGAQAGHWPAWRGGVDGSGRTAEKQLPTQWTEKQNVRWKVELPDRGNSTPAVWGQRIFLTQAIEDSNQRTLLCLDRATGRKLWQKGTTWAKPESSHETNPHCSSSPVADEKRVIAWFGSAGVFAYDHDGRELWHRDLGEQSHTWGYGSSPVIYQNTVILFFGPGPRQFLIALDHETGKTQWQTEAPALVNRPRTDGFRGREQGGMIGTFASPIIAHGAHGDELIMTFPQLLMGFDPKTGRELWRCDGLNELIYASPLANDEIAVGMGGFFGNTIAVKRGGKGDLTETHLLWKKERTKNRLGTGVIHAGHLYQLNSDGIAECLDLQTGETQWEERLPKKGPKGDVWASLLLAGDSLYALNQSGDTVILKASPKFEVVSVNPLDNVLTNASLAVSDGELFIRTHTHLWCIASLETKTAALPPTARGNL